MQNTLLLLAAIAVVLVIGVTLRARAGRVRPATGPGTASGTGAADSPSADLRRLLLEAGVSRSGPTILHFSATWCGPCAAVRRVVAQTIPTLADEGLTVLDLELDIDENPSLATALKVLSLPTTFLVDASGAVEHRISGVPKADALRAALRQL